MEDKMIEIARFQLATDAEMLASLLQSEGVECYVRDGFSSGLMFGKETGSAKVELLRKEMSQAVEIMKDHGYEIPEDILEQLASADSEPDDAGFENSKARLSKTMTIMIVLIIVLFGLLIFLNQYFKGQS